MYKFPRPEMEEAASLLHMVKDSPSRLDLVIALQRLLIRRIARVEKRIKRIRNLKAGLKRSMARNRWPKEKALSVKHRADTCDVALKQLQNLLFVWRCFGDGIAFIFQDKHALKQLYYDSEYRIKKPAGFLTGKSGFRREWKFLRIGISMDVPVILSDLTNIIRHGDLCALAGADPLLIEVKSSENRNARTSRQIKELNALSDFFTNDGARAWRGGPRTIRRASEIPEINHFSAINQCINESAKAGFSTINPEPGLRYFAVASEADIAHIDLGLSTTSVLYILQPTPSWSVAYPFTLSLNTPNLLKFLSEEVSLAVSVDLAIVKTLFAKNGTHATMLMNGEVALQYCLNPENLMEGVFRISEQRFGRIACEFQSLAWFAEAMASQLTTLGLPAVTREQLEASPEDFITEPPSGWVGVRDFWELPSNP